MTKKERHRRQRAAYLRGHPSIRAEIAGQYVKTVAEPKKEGSLGQKGPSSPPKKDPSSPPKPKYKSEYRYADHRQRKLLTVKH